MCSNRKVLALIYRNECPTGGSAAHNRQHWLQNKRAWNLRARCELRWKQSEEKRSHTWRNMVWWASQPILRCCSGSHELWVVGVCQVIAVDLCLVHLKTLLPETAFQIRLGFGLVLCSALLSHRLAHRKVGVKEMWYFSFLQNSLHFRQEQA